jgi:hypothetical protein
MIDAAGQATSVRRRKVLVAATAVALAAAVAVAVFIVTMSHPTSTTPPPGTHSGKTCPVAISTADSTNAIQTAIQDCAGGGTVSLAAGVYAISSHLPVRAAETITGAGPTSTFIVQHGKQNIFEITSSYVTIENLNLNTATYNASAPVLKNPNPGVLYSGAGHTSIINVTGEAGSGFGLRVTGPNPCAGYPTTGTVLSNINMTTTGKGGFAAVDVDCTNGARLSNITIHGGILAMFKDENVTLTGETFTPGPQNTRCEPALYITGPATNITVTKVQSQGGGVEVKQPATSIAIHAVSAVTGCQAIINHAAPSPKA